MDENIIQINKIELATELASKRVNERMSNWGYKYEEIYEDLEDGTSRYTEYAQDLFNNWYDEFLTEIESCNIEDKYIPFTREIGDIFEDNSTKLQVVADPVANCTNCYYRTSSKCEIKNFKKASGACCNTDRTDNVLVSFQEVINKEINNMETLSVDQEIILDKELRVELDKTLQKVKELSNSRERNITITKIQEAIMWLGMDLKRLGNPNPYPQSYNPESTVVEPTADGLTM